MKNIEQINLGNNETISLAKGKFGYRVIHPHKDQNGNIIWINLLIGGWENFFKLLFIMFVLGCFFYGFQEVTESCNDMTKNPCKYFDLDCTRYYNEANYNLLNDIQFDVGDIDDKT